MTKEEFEKFMDSELGYSITIKKYCPYKCISTWGPDWLEGICMLESNVTISGNNQHPHAKPSQFIPETRITPEVMKKIINAITQIINEENIQIE